MVQQLTLALGNCTGIEGKNTRRVFLSITLVLEAIKELSDVKSMKLEMCIGNI